MKKPDLIRGLKADLKSLEYAKQVSNIDYHRGKMDQLKSLIEDLGNPVQCKRYQGVFKVLPSRDLTLIEN